MIDNAELEKFRFDLWRLLAEIHSNLYFKFKSYLVRGVPRYYKVKYKILVKFLQMYPILICYDNLPFTRCAYETYVIVDFVQAIPEMILIGPLTLKQHYKKAGYSRERVKSDPAVLLYHIDRQDFILADVNFLSLIQKMPHKNNHSLCLYES